MPLTFGLTGMDPDTEASLKAAFTEANNRTGGLWQLQPETDAEYVVVDMDSLYGPMSWLRLHAAGKTVIGLTSAPRTQTDHHLSYPFDANTVSRLLLEVATKAGYAPQTGETQPPSPAGLTPAPQPQDLLPEEQPQPASEEVAPPPEPSAAVPGNEVPTADRREPPSAAVAQVVPPAPTIQPRTPAPVAAQEQTLVEWLASGRLSGRIRVERDGVALLIDNAQREYFGPTVLKPLTAHLQAQLSPKDLEQVDPAEWSRQTASMGAAQPLLRLVWFGNLLGGGGKLVPGFDPAARFQLLKWPQTEREFPKHFRIATAMMKGPATLPEIAAGSGVPLPEVIDFVNANLATGFADVEHAQDPEPEPTKSTGLFGRLRGR
ncbi:MAG: hypothetical protein M3Q42_06975 [Pseudomonadota bacterium]|nr:hypothetical protein [Pseudomonadota bacterium]